ncbi:MAG: DUF1501 domain-containing protein [Verrucomicrobiales bacterium]
MKHPISPDPTCGNTAHFLTRRDALRGIAGGFGWLALAGLAARTAPAAPAGAAAAVGDSPLAPKVPHFAPRAKRVIFLCMRGGPSHVDTFDYKPDLATAAAAGKAGQRPGTKLMAPPWAFKPRGQSGLWISDLFPEVARHADKLCLLRSMQTDVPAHPQAFLRLHTGSSQFVRPSLGAWSLYGLGTANENLPGFITLTPPAGFGGAQNYGSSFLPAIYQGTRIGSDNRPIESATIRNLAPRGKPSAQRKEVDLIQALNRRQLAKDPQNKDIEGVIESYELAFKMQSELPVAMDLDTESEATRTLYGLGNAETEDFGRKCLLARRFLDAGVRFVEISHGNWDHHFNLTASLERSCAAVDAPIAGLLADLAQRDMLRDTLVVWSGEFGRTPHSQGSDGRDHNNKGFTAWMAGGGVRGGFSYGATDDLGYAAADQPMSIHDFHATILHLLGLDHERLTFNYAGRDFRLTDVHGKVAKEILA